MFELNLIENHLLAIKRRRLAASLVTLILLLGAAASGWLFMEYKKKNVDVVEQDRQKIDLRIKNQDLEDRTAKYLDQIADRNREIADLENARKTLRNPPLLSQIVKSFENFIGDEPDAEDLNEPKRWFRRLSIKPQTDSTRVASAALDERLILSARMTIVLLGSSNDADDQRRRIGEVWKNNPSLHATLGDLTVTQLPGTKIIANRLASAEGSEESGEGRQFDDNKIWIQELSLESAHSRVVSPFGGAGTGP